MKYLIIGLGKSGTTALFSAVKNCIEENARYYFEPRNLENLKLSGSKNIIAKVLIDNVNEKNQHRLNDFDKKILIVRDPRDLLISKLLYRTRGTRDTNPFMDNDKAEKFLDYIKQKEKNPNSISILELYELQDFLSNKNSILKHLEKLHRKLLQIAEAQDFNCFILKYEDYITGNIVKAQNYLDLNIKCNVEVDETFERVKRTKSFGDWKNWFTEDDVNYVKKNYKFFMEYFGYTDWAQPQNKTINLEFASHYVKKILDLRKQGK